LETGETVSDITIQRPVVFYGISKLYCEGLGRYYRNKYGLDFRCVRYPAVVGPGVNTAGHWIPPMMEDAIQGKPHDSLVSGNATSWVISLKDAARAARMVLQAPKDCIKMVNYNVAGCNQSIKAEEIVTVIMRRYPDAVIRFKQDQNNSSAFKGYSGNYDDSYARKEWGWKPDHFTIDLIFKSFIRDIRRLSK
jgi:threonine 3-dehydrogenase